MNLGGIALKLGDPGAAKKWLEQSIAERGGMEFPNHERIAQALFNLSVAEIRLGGREAAREYATQSLYRFAEAQAWVAIPHALEVLGIVESAFEHWERAVNLLAAAESLAASQGASLLALVSQERGQTLVHARDIMGQDFYENAFESGQRWLLDEAVRFALCDLI